MKISKNKPLVVILLIIIAALGYYEYKSIQNEKAAQDPNYCIKCHEMQPAFYTWKATTHNKLKCTVCHEVSIADFQYKHNNGYLEPVKMKDDISNTICLQCHDKNKSVTPPGDLIIPHQLHLQKGLDCIDCHNNIAHADSVEKIIAPKLLAPKDFGSNEAKLLIKNNNGVPMSKCLNCHNGKMAPKDCGACHKVERLPNYHKTSDWGYNHGAAAFGNLTSCNKCHGEDLALTKKINIADNSKTNVANFARSNLFCQNCHKERPLTHTTLFAIDHGKDAKTSKENCYICHDEKIVLKAGNIGQPATDIYCRKCHVTSHPQDWIDVHKAKAVLYGKAKCLTCHNEASSCNSCHQKNK